MIPLLHAGFVVAGMATTLLGPVVPVLARQWAMGDAAAGALFTAQFACQTAAAFVSSWITARLGNARTLALGFLLVVFGVATLAFASRPIGIVATCVYGLGLGLVLPITNFVVAALRPRTAAAALSLLNLSWGVGAVLWPLVVRAAGTPASVAAPLLALAAGAMGLAAVFGGAYARRLDAPGPVDPTDAAPLPGTTFGAGGPALGPLLALLGASTFLYVGIETALGGWIAEYTRRLGGTEVDGIWAFAPTAFWGAETLGRLLAPAFLRVVREGHLLPASLVLAGGATAGLAFATDTATAAVAGAALAGFGLAPVFPLLLAVMSREVAPRAPRAMGPLFAAGGIGGATIPWVVGFTSARTGALETGLAVPLASIVLLLVFDAARGRLPARQSPSD